MISSLLVFLAILSAASLSDAGAGVPHQIHHLRPRSGSGGQRILGVSCLSWRLGVETNNIRDWKLVPEVCEGYVGNYMLGHQYRKDCNAVAYAAVQYAKSIKPAGDGKDIWVFDIDETSLSNLPYFARSDVAFGAKAYNATAINEWVMEGKAPAVPGVILLYKQLVKLGYKVVFLTGRTENQRQITTQNLNNVGYHSWENLILNRGRRQWRTSRGGGRSWKRADTES
ncbi:acid phosphatase 1-like isoform X2 [Malania oleifera]|uniref:acid phosphatase 1-like isoform X2 n=1 Tax=Malania oleifera TaxID=397392 RepID=UPI0025ADBDE5|nr:acid phosphatase 1-like isoform X2 [Malania oleifera]